MDPAAQDGMSATSIPKVTRVLAALLALATALAHIPGFGKSLIDNFALIPSATLGQSKLWNVVTGGFIDINPVEGILNVLLVLTMGKWIETSWGGRSFLVFIMIVNFLSASSTYAMMVGAYVATRKGSFIFDPIGTTNGICVALLVAVKQLIPEHEIGVNGVNMSANYLPVVYATVVFVFTALQFVRIGVFVFTAAAFQCSWTYLRFYQRKDNARGDLSDSFAYATLFPDPVRRFVLVMANMSFAIFRPLLTAGLTQPQESQAAPQPTSKAASIDAERRRQRALKALDERLNATANDEEQGEGQV